MPPHEILPLDDPIIKTSVNITVNSEPPKEPKKPSEDISSSAINETADITNEYQNIPEEQNGDLENQAEESHQISQKAANNVFKQPLSSNGNENHVPVNLENGVSPVTDLSGKSETDANPAET